MLSVFYKKVHELILSRKNVANLNILYQILA